MVTLKGHITMSIGNRDGSYTIPDVPPGHYTLVTDAYSRANRLGEVETGFDVTNSDVTLRVKVGG
jgi:hypothetical protein